MGTLPAFSSARLTHLRSQLQCMDLHTPSIVISQELHHFWVLVLQGGHLLAELSIGEVRLGQVLSQAKVMLHGPDRGLVGLQGEVDLSCPKVRYFNALGRWLVPEGKWTHLFKLSLMGKVIGFIVSVLLQIIKLQTVN